MPFAAWVRDRLWRANNWCAELAEIRQGVMAERRSTSSIERMFDAASATEYCDPDRGRALTLHLEAWRSGHEGAGLRAKQLANTLGAHMTIAEIALAEGDALAAGTAFLDAGFRELAVEPLKRFIDARPAGGSPTTEELRLEDVTALLALARSQRFDGEREIADTLARARQATGRAASAAYLHAARVARAANLGDRLGAILNAASRACPNDDTIARLVEARLFEISSTSDELLAHFGARLELATSRIVYVDRARAAGAELVARNYQPGLGLRLLRMSLDHAYSALLPEITSHIAAWELLWTHARAQRSTLELLPLLERALSAPVSEDDALYLARLGLEITWWDSCDTLAARPYAAMVLEAAPGHPLAVAFLAEAPPEIEVAPGPAVTDCSTSSPAGQRSLARSISGLEGAIATPSPKLTSRIPVHEGPVKRAVSAASTAATPHGVTGRMALLKPPPPREPPIAQPIARPIAQPIAPVTSPARAAPQPTPSTAFAARAARKVVPVDVVVELPGGGFFSTVLRDLSTSGAFIITKRQLEIGTSVALELRIPVPGSLAQSSYRTNARIARRTDLGWGLAFIDASPELVAAILATIT